MRVAAPRFRLRRLAVVLLVLIATSVTGLAFAPSADAALVDPFTKVFSTNTTGDILIRGNSSMTCPTATAGCQAARNTVGGGTASVTALNNNNWNMVYSNSDTTTPGVFDSSASTVQLPTGSTVLFAALVWSARTAAGTNGVAAVDATTAGKGTVLLRTPGGTGYSTVTSTRTSTSDGYQGYADVTSLVRSGGSGDYTVANIQAGTGQDRYAGWSLAIAYSDPTAPLRNLSLFSGFATVANTTGNTTVDIPVSGFTTPPFGAVRTTVGAVAWEGDAGSTGDQLLLGSDVDHLTNLSDGLHASTNVFNSVISTRGTDPGGRSPNYNNNLGVDLATLPADGDLTNGSTSAVVRFTTTSETYFPGLMSFATNLYAPEIDLTKTATFTKAPGNTQTQLLEPGDTVTYSITGSNSGSDAAAPTALTDTIPSGTSYVPGSLTIGGSAVTDGSGDDLGSYTASSRLLTASLGTGATPSTGGSVAIGAAIAPVTFKVTVDPVTTSGTLTNTARIDYTGVTSGRSVYGASNTLLAVAYEHRSDLGVTMTQDTPAVQRGAATTVTYHATVTNSGPYDEPAAVLTDVLPSGATVVSATPSSGSCTTTSGTVTCALGAMVSGATRTVDVLLRLDGAPRLALSTASVHGTNADVVPANDSAPVTTGVNTAPVAVPDSVTTTDAAHGGTATFNPAANDTDADPDTLAVTSVSSGTRGTAVLQGDGTVTYTAAAGQAGSDSFTYTVSDGQGGTATGTVSVTIPDAPPVAVDDATSTTVLTPVDVDVLGNDTDVNIPTIGSQSLSVSSFTQPPAGTGTVAVSGSGVRFTPSSTFVSGTTTFTYTVSDGAGGAATGTVSVTIANSGPVAAADTATTPYLTAADVDVLANDTDPNNDTLTLTGVQGAAHGTATVVAGQVHYVPATGWSGPDSLTYTISDGHGGTATGALEITTGNGSPTAGDLSASVPGGTDSVVDVLAHSADPNGDPLTVIGTGAAEHGSVVTDSDGRVHYLPDPAFRGTDHFTYTVSDGNGATATGTVTVTVANQAPVAAQDTAVVPVNGSVDVDPLANDTDPNGDDLTLTAPSSTSHGTVVVHDDGTLTYTPERGYQGDDSFTYTVSDGHGGTDSSTITVTVADTPPVAASDSVDYRQTVGTPLEIDPLDNDTDANGDPLHLTASDSTSTHGGTITRTGDQLSYIPDPSYVGDDSFTYTVSDGRGGLAIGTVTVHVINRNPHAVDDSATTARGTAQSIDVLVNDTDPDGDSLTLQSTDPTSAHGGTISVVGGQARYTPVAGYQGTDSFDYTVQDARGATATATVRVTVTNTDPVAHDFALEVPGGTDTDIDALAHASDPDGDTVALDSTSTPAHGTVLAHGDGSLTYTPDAAYRGADSFTYTVSDGHGGTDTGTVTLTVANQPPVAVDDTRTLSGPSAPATIAVLTNDTDPNHDTLTVSSVTQPLHGSASTDGTTVLCTPDPTYAGADSFSYTVSDGHDGTSTATVHLTTVDGAPTAADDSIAVPRDTTTAIDVLANDTDPDGEQLSLVSVGDPAHGTTAVVGGHVVYTPSAGYVGTDSFGYTVVDPRGATASATVSVRVGNSPPQTTPVATVLTGPVGGSYPLDVLVHDSDPDGDSLHLVSVGDPQHGRTAIVGGHVVYTPDALFAGVDTFTYVVADAYGALSTGTVSVTVVDRAPVTVPMTFHMTGDHATRLHVLTHDSDPDDEAIHIVSVSRLGAKGGTVVIRRGLPVYTPRPGFAGTDTFTYTVADPRGATATAMVTVMVAAAVVTPTPTTPTPSPSPTTGGSTPPATPAPRAGALPDTGGPSRRPLVAGIVLVLLGCALVSRRRRRTP